MTKAVEICVLLVIISAACDFFNAVPSGAICFVHSSYMVPR